VQTLPPRWPYTVSAEAAAEILAIAAGGPLLLPPSPAHAAKVDAAATTPVPSDWRQGVPDGMLLAMEHARRRLATQQQQMPLSSPSAAAS